MSDGSEVVSVFSIVDVKVSSLKVVVLVCVMVEMDVDLLVGSVVDDSSSSQYSSLES